MEKRAIKRIPVNLEANIISNGSGFAAYIVNISETGLQLIVSPGKKAIKFSPDTDYALECHLSSGEKFTLNCRLSWSDKFLYYRHTQVIGLKIIDPPAEYKKYFQKTFYDVTNDISHSDIAVIGMASHYPGASNLKLFWENILAQRREFRQIPDQRLPLSEYYDPDPSVPDKTYANQAAVIDGFDFDWIKMGIPKTVIESSDIAQWLALEVSLKALEDAGYGKGKVSIDRTGVILGNTLTGEHSRSQNMRLRWPYVKKSLVAAATQKGLPKHLISELTTIMEGYYKSSFAPVTEDTLAGNLSNTIAGRICNFLDLHGGGYTVDGACSSSLIAVATAATALSNGNLDMAITGGVDISLDTFELIGFAKTNALTKDSMRVYDRRANGFIPGEGCGFVVLKRLADARADGNKVYATLRGWGISSDGKGGMTAPKAQAQAYAIKRAYTSAKYGLQDIDFIEGHGTGTPAGDKAELEGIALAMGDHELDALRSCGITSLKSIIGHTKAASGIGGFIKTVMAVNRRILPPVAGCEKPSTVFNDTARDVYPIRQGAIRGSDSIIRAGVSGMGFGGINCHVTLESGDPPIKELAPTLNERALLASCQESELFVLAAHSHEGLHDQVQHLAHLAPGISIGQIVDLAASLTNEISHTEPFRASFLASSPQELSTKLSSLETMLREGSLQAGSAVHNVENDIWLGNQVSQSKVGFLFPGQGAQHVNMARVLVERYSWAQDLIDQIDSSLENGGYEKISPYIFKPLDRVIDSGLEKKWKQDLTQTEIAQPAICLASVLWSRYLENLGITPLVVGGHSLGELTACYQAGAFSAVDLIRLAACRGRLMAGKEDHPGTMVSFTCNKEEAEALLRNVDGYAVVANINSPAQTVLSGEPKALERAMQLASEQGIRSTRLRVSNGFHSDFVKSAAQDFKNKAKIPSVLQKNTITLLSCMDGQQVESGIDLRHHFANQMVSQVDFISLVEKMSLQCDLMIEVGPGRVLTDLARAITGRNEAGFPVAARAEDDHSLNRLLGLYFVHGGEVKWPVLYEKRLVRPFVPSHKLHFIDNQCERPFDVTPVSSHDRSNGFHDGALSLLADAAEVSHDTISNYISLRSRFLGTLIKADLEDFTSLPEGNNNITEKESERVETAVLSTDFHGNIEGPETATHPKNVITTLLESIEKRTGFPRESLDPALRLLDDLNLDSIKAAELIAETAKKFNVTGNVDASQYANATIAEVADAFELILSELELPDNSRSDSSGQIVVTDLLLELIEERTGFPRESLSLTLRLLDDLNLDSIKAAELIAESANKLGLRRGMDPTPYANATIQEIGAAFDQILAERKKSTNPVQPGRETWVRNFIVSYTAEELIPDTGAHEASGLDEENILILADSLDEQHVVDLKTHLNEQGADAVVISFDDASEASFSTNIETYSTIIGILPRSAPKTTNFEKRLSEMVGRLQTLIASTRDAVKDRRITACFIQYGGGEFGSGGKQCEVDQCATVALAASLHYELPDARIRVLDFDPDIDSRQFIQTTCSELLTGQSFVAAGYDGNLQRRIPTLILQEPVNYSPRSLTWTSDDVILVTGGAKGITAECAFALAKETGVKMALVGSSSFDPTDSSGAIAQTLQRFHDAGLNARYYQCDIVDGSAVDRLMQDIKWEQGAVTGVIHGSALNIPRALHTVSRQEALQEVSPKVLGAVHLCRALQDTPPKLFIGFSSIIGVSGMIRNGWYGFSNETLNLVLQQFHDQHPETSVLSIAYSIWDDVGMGVRMGSTGYLAGMGIGAIPAKEGVRRFMQLMFNDPGEQQVVIAARLASLDTIAPKPFALPSSSRFLEKIMYAYPGVETTVRAHLSLEKDEYIKDHLWRGTYLFPTVFGLEAMAQAVAFVTGKRNFEMLRIEDIRLERPITVPPDEGAEIEIHAQVLEKESGQKGTRIRVGIATSQTGFTTDHFSATFVLGDLSIKPTEELQLPGQPLDIDPKNDLYDGKLLFQGPMYQRIETIFSLDGKECVFQTRCDGDDEKQESSQKWLLGDPYCRDTLLHATQLPVAQHICLPLTIKKIELYKSKQTENTALFGVVAIEKQNDSEIHARISVVDEAGNVVERLHGYVLKVMEHHPEYPAAEEIARPDQRDLNLVQGELSKRTAKLGYFMPEIAVHHLPGLSDTIKEKRHELEVPLVKKLVKRYLTGQNSSANDITIKWQPSGKPQFDTDSGAAIDLSLAHTGNTLFCVVHAGKQGCDIESITSRTREEWVAIIGENNRELLQELLDGGDSLDHAGARIWTAREALFKANEQTASTLVLLSRDEDSVVFQNESSVGGEAVLTFPLELTRKPEKMIAVVVEQAPTEAPAVSLPHDKELFEGLNFDVNSYKVDIRKGLQGQPKFAFQFPVSFKEASNPSRTIYFSQYFQWLGKLREFAIQPIYADLVDSFSTGKMGMVTNHAETNIFDTAQSGDIIEGHVWVNKVSGKAHSTIEMCFDWWKRERDGGSNKQIAFSTMSTTWVAIRGYGVVEVQSFPDFVRKYISDVLPTSISINQGSHPESNKYSSQDNFGEELFQEPIGPVNKLALLHERVFETTLDDSNFVGNIYFSKYYSWQGHVRDHFIHQAAPEYFGHLSKLGELRCVHCKVNHMSEAMPFERIAVKMYRKAVYERSIRFHFEYYRITEDGETQKIGFGTHHAVWYEPDMKGVWKPAALPGSLCEIILSDKLNTRDYPKINKDLKIINTKGVINS